jgi:hypothetical protein
MAGTQHPLRGPPKDRGRGCQYADGSVFFLLSLYLYLCLCLSLTAPLLVSSQGHLQGQVDAAGQQIATLVERSGALDERVSQLSVTSASKDELREAQQLLERQVEAASTTGREALADAQQQLEQKVRASPA